MNKVVCLGDAAEHEPPLQRNDETGVGGTAKATAALGTLPYRSDATGKNSVA
jgi:hypothetical protein